MERMKLQYAMRGRLLTFALTVFVRQLKEEIRHSCQSLEKQFGRQLGRVRVRRG